MAGLDYLQKSARGVKQIAPMFSEAQDEGDPELGRRTFGRIEPTKPTAVTKPTKPTLASRNLYPR